MIAKYFHCRRSSKDEKRGFFVIIRSCVFCFRSFRNNTFKATFWFFFCFAGWLRRGHCNCSCYCLAVVVIKLITTKNDRQQPHYTLMCVLCNFLYLEKMNEVDCCCCFAVDWMQASKQEFQFSNCRRTLHFDGVVVVMIISRFTIHYLILLIYSFAVCTISSHCLDQKEEVRFFINGWLRNEKRHKLNSCFISTNREIWQHRERARTRENLFSNKCYTLLWMISYFF